MWINMKKTIALVQGARFAWNDKPLVIHRAVTGEHSLLMLEGYTLALLGEAIMDGFNGNKDALLALSGDPLKLEKYALGVRIKETFPSLCFAKYVRRMVDGETVFLPHEFALSHRACFAEFIDSQAKKFNIVISDDDLKAIMAGVNSDQD